MKAALLLLALSAVEGLAASPGILVTLGGDLRFEQPADWTLHDQWFRDLPFATLTSPAEPVVTMRLERYAEDNPLHLTPRGFAATLTTRRSEDEVSRRETKLGGRPVTVYEVRTPPVPGRAPDYDEVGDVLGGGKPGIRSKEARCVQAGAYLYPAAYNATLNDQKAAADFRTTFLDEGHLSRVIEICLGAPLLAQMRRGEPIEHAPEAPDEKELARLEALDTSPAIPEGWESIAVVEGEGRFYLLRFSGPAERYRAEKPVFERVAASLELLIRK